MTKAEMAPFSLRWVNRQWLVSGVVANGHECLLGDDVTEERGCSYQALIPPYTLCVGNFDTLEAAVQRKSDSTGIF